MTVYEPINMTLFIFLGKDFLTSDQELVVRTATYGLEIDQSQCSKLVSRLSSDTKVHDISAYCDIYPGG